MHLTPAKYVVKIFGGVRAAATLIGRNPSSICRWQMPKSRGGYGGAVPRAARLRILEIAKKKRLPITSWHLDYGYGRKN